MQPTRTAVQSITLAATLAAVTLVSACGAPEPRFLLGGIQVNEPDHPAWFVALRSEGFNTVSATVYAKQGDWDQAHLWWEDDEPHVVAEIREAKRSGLRVVLIPRVALDHAFPRNLFLWHGMILPDGEDRIRAWFDLYRTFVLRWARVAESEGVDLFGIGSELSSLTSTRPVEAIPALEAWNLDAEGQERRKQAMLTVEGELESRDLWIRGKDDFESLDAYLDAEIAANRAWADRTAFGASDDAVARINRRSAMLDGLWRALIADVRAVYGGRLTYAANFDQYDRVGFWDALDCIGVNAYWTLRPGGRDLPATELPAALEAGWTRVVEDLDDFRTHAGVPSTPVVFTEIGYTWRRNGTVQPWAGTGFWLRLDEDDPKLFVWGDQPRDLDERAEAIRALDRVLGRRDGPALLTGLLWWKLTSLPEHRAIEPFVAVLGDPAEDQLFRALRDLANRPERTDD